MVPAGEPGHGDDVADDGGGDDRPDAGHLGEAGTGCRDRGGQLLVDLAPLGVQMADAASSSAASSQRAWATAPAGATCSRILAAWPAVISSGTPPGISSHSTAWRRQTTWLRVRERSRWRLARTFSTTAWPSAVTSWRLLDRNAATATDRASSGSVLFVSRASSSRTRAASLGCTSSTRSPAATSCRASSRPPAGAFHRPGPLRPGLRPATSSRPRSGQARTRSLPSGSSAAPTATAVCEPLCGPVPIITAISALPSSPATRRTAAGMPHTGPALGARPSFEPRHGKVRRSRHIDLKPGTPPAGGSGPAPPDLSGRYVNRSAQSGWSL